MQRKISIYKYKLVYKDTVGQEVGAEIQYNKPA